MSGSPAANQGREAAMSLLMDVVAASLVALAETVETMAQVGATSRLRIAKRARAALMLRLQHRLAAVVATMATTVVTVEIASSKKDLES